MATISQQFSFDTVAASYDGQRAHPPAIATRIGATIAGLVGTGGQVLELGVGTGRIALPVAAAGSPVIGIDISREMLRVAQNRRLATDERRPAVREDVRASLVDGRSSVTLLQGAIARLPFRDGAFDAVLAVHVLHLVPDWRGALAEAMRVLRPGGLLIQGSDWRSPESVAGKLRSKLREAVIELRPGIRPPGAGAAVPQVLAKLGGSPAGDVVAAEWTSTSSPAEVLSDMASRNDAETWPLDDELLAGAMERLQAFAAATWPDLEAAQDVPRRFTLTLFRKAT